MKDEDRATCFALAGLLRASAVLAAWGFAASVIAALVLTLGSPATKSAMALGAVATLGMLERYFAFRLRLDQTLFVKLADGGIASLSILDLALQRLGLRAAGAQPRDLADRVDGTRTLLRRHAIVVGCQGAMFLLALLTREVS